MGNTSFTNAPKPSTEPLEKQIVDIFTRDSKQYLLYKDGHLLEISSGNAVTRYEPRDPALARILALYRHSVR
jgi:hypothetical protein